MKSILRAILAVSLMITAAHAKSGMENAHFQRDLLFEVTPEGEYQSIRIPCLLALPNNTVLAIVSARSTPSDWATIRLLMRRSTDGGMTWSPATVLAEDGKNVTDNPVAIWDDEKKVVHFLYQVNYARIYHMESKDYGATFSSPVEITPQLEAFQKWTWKRTQDFPSKINPKLKTFQEEYAWKVIAPGPGHGLQMKNGRLVVPVWLCPGIPNPSGHGLSHRPSVASVIYSDDHGKTWNCGDILPDVLKNLSEGVAVSADDDGVLLYVRNEEPKAFKVAVSHSKDGATGWSTPKLHKDLFGPVCFSSVLRLSGSPDKSRILFCNPDSSHNPKVFGKFPSRTRENLTLKLSYDGGDTWPVVKVVDPGRSSYSDMTMLPDGTILCLYEHGYTPNPFNSRYVSVVRFNLEWITDGKDSLKKK